MTVETSTIAAIIGDGNIGARISDRMYAYVLPDETALPAIVWQVVSRAVHGGTCYRTRMQLRLLATSASALKGLRDDLQTLVEATSNWVWSEGPDGREENEGLYFQLVDLIIT